MNAPLRRGACPGLSAPMQTGDGLLVRLLPIGTVPLGAFKKLCTAARKFGNGIVEVTTRGSIQVRGLDAASAPRFAAAVGALGIAAQDGVPIHANPLAGLDPDEIVDASALAADLRRALADSKLPTRLSPKVSVVVDGGGALALDGLSADIRLHAESVDGATLLRTSVGGDDVDATDVGLVGAGQAVEAATRLLEVIARHGSSARARDVLAAAGVAPFQAALAKLLRSSFPSPRVRGEGRVDPGSSPGQALSPQVGRGHELRDRSFAFGLGLAFGHADATSLENLTETAAAMGAAGIRAAPGRSLIVIGVAREALTAFAAEVERPGFITRGDDPRRQVFACAGAPICGAAHMAARTMAPRIAAANAKYLRGLFTIHLSGCAKGCALAAPAALAIVGTSEGCALIANGTARDAPFAIVPKEQVTAAIARHIRELTGEDAHV